MVFSKPSKYFFEIVLINVFLISFLFLESLILNIAGLMWGLLIVFSISLAIFFVFKFILFKINSILLNKMNTEFILMLAHKIKTALTASRWSLKMFLDGDFGETTKEQKEVVEKIYKKNNSVISSINDLLDLSTIQSGVFVYNMKFFHIEDVLNSVMGEYQDKAKSKNIQLSLQASDHLPQVTIDKEKMELALENLVDNALKYTADGGKIKISVNQKDSGIEISVADSGIGISAPQQKYIFSKFFRSERANNFEREGTGLGLFITKNIIEAHGGKIWFESKEDVGTTFHVDLPLALH